MSKGYFHNYTKDVVTRLVIFIFRYTPFFFFCSYRRDWIKDQRSWFLQHCGDRKDLEEWNELEFHYHTGPNGLSGPNTDNRITLKNYHGRK